MKIKVGVFFGGISVEHEVSIISALQAIHSMDNEKYEIIPVYITKEGLWYTGEDLLDIENFKDINKLLGSCKKISIVNNLNEKIIIKYPLSTFGKNIINNIDVAFPVVHGTNCEDGSLQGFFETAGIPYVGCDVLSSAVGMDKIIAKKVLKESGVPVINYVDFYSCEWLRDSAKIIERIEATLKYPVIIKPANTGSSVGIKKAANRDELEEAVEYSRGFSPRILVEDMVVKIREINCSVLGDYENAEASVCEEPITSSEILTYQDKYLNNGTKGMSGATRKLPAELPEEMSEEIRRLAVKTFNVLGCSGVSRIDFIIDASINKVYVNEINTIPGSLAFYLWEATGKPYKQLIDELINLALKRDREKKQLTFTYETNILAMQSGTKGIKK